MIWFTSDQHFGHEPIIGFCARPFQSVGEMDAELVRKYNSGVKPDDTCYFLGDVFFHSPTTSGLIAKQLNGKKILVRGNHDKHTRTQYESWGFTVVDELLVELTGRKVRMSHYPYWPDKDQEPDVQKKELRYKDRRPQRGWGNEFLLCGHIHQWWKTQGRMVNVGVDVWNYKPVSLGQIEKLFSEIERGHH